MDTLDVVLEVGLVLLVLSVLLPDLLDFVVVDVQLLSVNLSLVQLLLGNKSAIGSLVAHEGIESLALFR